jgi:hypothetical protein
MVGQAGIRHEGSRDNTSCVSVPGVPEILGNPALRGGIPLTGFKEICYALVGIEPSPVAVCGGWRLRLIGRDLETGGKIEIGGATFKVEDGEDERDAVPTPCRQARNGWIQICGPMENNLMLMNWRMDVNRLDCAKASILWRSLP